MKALLLPLLVAAPFAVAGPFEPATIPADSNWYLHANLTNLRQTITGSSLINFIRESQAETLAEIENIMQFDPLADLTDITLFGSGQKDQDALVLRGDFSQARFEEVIVNADNHQTSTHGSTTVHQWDDKGKTQHAGFHDGKTVIISSRKDLVHLGLDVLAQKKPGLPATVELPAKDPAVVVFANVDKVDMPDDEGSRIIRQAKSLMMTVGENKQRLEMTMTVETDDPFTTERLARVMEGLIALGQLADEKVSALEIQTQTQIADKTMTMTMDLSAIKALELLSQMR